MISGTDVDIDDIKDILFENGINNVTTEKTPYGNSIKIAMVNPSQEQLQAIQDIRKTVNLNNKIFKPITSTFGSRRMIEFPSADITPEYEELEY